MSITVAGFVKNGVVVPNAPLPEGARVEILVSNEPEGEREKARRSARPFPRARQVVLVPLGRPPIPRAW
jgi:hypothetical protein